jgi:hypothetical protein
VFVPEVNQGVNGLEVSDFVDKIFQPDTHTQRQAALHNYTTACPNTPIVIHGYSQGGVVVMNTLCGGSSPWTTPSSSFASAYVDNVIAVILYGEETYANGQPYNVGACHADSNFQGVSSLRCSSSSLCSWTDHLQNFARTNSAACAPYAPVMQSYCLPDDSACCGSANLSNPNAANGQIWHFQYPNYFEYVYNLRQTYV